MDEFSDQIGGRLQEAREAAGLSVDDIMFRTRLPRSVIVALEAGDFSVFSSPTYAKSFLAQYSGFLNVEADPWLDALQPASFISGDSMSPLWVSAGSAKEEVVPDRASSGSWFSALLLFGLTCAMVLAAIKGYEFFEAKFGTEVSAKALIRDEEKAPPQTVPGATAPRTAEPPPPPEKTPEEDPVQPPPRAIIVR
ncbi:MAG: helix-turn-helix transcriptional regulator [Verrucomicrobiota bacterium]